MLTQRSFRLPMSIEKIRTPTTGEYRSTISARFGAMTMGMDAVSGSGPRACGPCRPQRRTRRIAPPLARRSQSSRVASRKDMEGQTRPAVSRDPQRLPCLGSRERQTGFVQARESPLQALDGQVVNKQCAELLSRSGDDSWWNLFSHERLEYDLDP